MRAFLFHFCLINVEVLEMFNTTKKKKLSSGSLTKTLVLRSKCDAFRVDFMATVCTFSRITIDQTRLPIFSKPRTRYESRSNFID